MKTGIIYKASFPSFKVYIGQTKLSLEERIRKHIQSSFNKSHHGYNTKICRAIRKYIGNIEWAVICKDIRVGSLDKLEIEMIKKFDSRRNGYNSTDGGNGCKGYKHTDAAKDKMSKLHKKGIRRWNS